MDDKVMLERLIERVVRGTLSKDRAVSRILQEFSRSKVTLVVDRDLLGLSEELYTLGYTVYPIVKSIKDDVIKTREIPGCVFITANGRHFVDDIKKYQYGLIWIDTTSRDRPTLAKRVEHVLKTQNFFKNRLQAVKVGDESDTKLALEER